MVRPLDGGRLRDRRNPYRTPGGAGQPTENACEPSAGGGDGLFELRFEMNRVAWRIPFFFAPNRRIVLLTVFRKQRMNESHEIERARRAMLTCIESQHDAEEKS